MNVVVAEEVAGLRQDEKYLLAADRRAHFEGRSASSRVVHPIEQLYLLQLLYPNCLATRLCCPRVTLSPPDPGPLRFSRGHPIRAPSTAGDGRCRLLYELHLTNFAPLPIELTGFDVLGDGASPLASYRAQALMKMVVPVEQLSSAESPSSPAGKTTIDEGKAALIFVDLTLDTGVRPHAELRHRFSFSVTRQNGDTFQRTLDGPPVIVVQQAATARSSPSESSGNAAAS
jgi:hypothetical protein